MMVYDLPGAFERSGDMPLLRERIYTIEDIYALPEGERAELIDGHIYYMRRRIRCIRGFQVFCPEK